MFKNILKYVAYNLVHRLIGLIIKIYCSPNYLLNYIIKNMQMREIPGLEHYTRTRLNASEKKSNLQFYFFFNCSRYNQVNQLLCIIPIIQK